MIAINDKVVCVDDSISGNYTYPQGMLVKGQVYVVSGIEIVNYARAQGHPGGGALSLYVVGKSRLWRGEFEVPWFHGYFRRLDELEEINRLKAQIGEPQEVFL